MKESIINEPYGFIYITTNMVNGMKYLGQKRFEHGKSWRSYLGSGVALNAAIKLYGAENFSRNIVCFCFSEEELNQLEYDLSVFLNVVENPNWYNIIYGGGGTSGYKATNEQREENRNRAIRQMANPDARENLRQKAKKQMSNPNMIKLLSMLKQGVYDGDRNPMYGKNHTDEAKQKISQKAKERLKNPKNNSMYGRGKRVVQLTKNGGFVKEYISADEAYRITGVDRSSIRKCCHHQVKSAGGFVWCFEEEYSKQLTTQND